MASTTYTGTHVICTYAGANQSQLDVMRKPVWAESMSVPGTSLNKAPELHGSYGEPTSRSAPSAMTHG
jgi:hypothetical protein